MLGYSIFTKPEGCCCEACCRMLGWDKPKSFLAIYERKIGEKRATRIKEIEIPSYAEREKYILEERLTLEDTYDKIMTPTENWVI